MCLSVKKRLEISYSLYQYYKNIIESYVSDYYVENHWKKLPNNWQNYLENISVEQLADLLDFGKAVTKGVLPLSLLCTRNIIINVAITRSKILKDTSVFKNEEFLKYFWKNVKLKKRHEIERIAQNCYETAVKSNCFYIVDIGSGLGHLSRMLSYGYGFKVCTFEADPMLSNLATELDQRFENNLKCKGLSHKNTFTTRHINKKIEYDIDWNIFLNIVVKAFNETSDDFMFGIVGLHPCGNLGSTLLRLFNYCPNVIFINMASCCYMKITLGSEDLHSSNITGFPLSYFCKHNNFKLTYLACEIACHAIENYVQRLRNEEDYSKLKIHAYRAALEQILLSVDTTLKHSAVCNVKYSASLSFKMYCDKIFNKLSVTSPDELVSTSEELINQSWKNVVVFYSLRLLFAPLIETIILFDRLLYIEDFNNYCEIIPLFDCHISPRNHVLCAKKKNIS